ncbi:hypothetical protein FQN50_001783 [Emmonsiellopsis sp. PD_5]|nr:hypothetical protein FQN50_001783 [Emmonsiellopsis sp. PD_5]
MSFTAQTVAPQGAEPLVFARLTPHNAAAYKAFRTVVDAMKRDPALLAHHRHFLHYDEPGRPLSSLLALHHSASLEVSGGSDVASSVSSSDQHTEEPPDDNLVYNGHYLFSLNVLPVQPTLGWMIGTGRRRGSNMTGAVDILLNCQPPFGRVHSRHAALSFHKNSGILQLESCHKDASVSLDMNPFTRLDGSRGLTRLTSLIEFGDLLYRFSYSDWPPAEEIRFQKQKDAYFLEHLRTPAPIQSTSATPSVNGIIIGNWNLHRTVGGGAFGIVNAASRLGGKLQVVAFKAMVRSDYFSDRNVDAEFLAALNLKKATENHEYKIFIIRMKEAIYERGSSVFDYSGPERVYFIYSPLARGTFSSHLLNDPAIIPTETRISLLTDIIKGLACLHDVQ